MVIFIEGGSENNGKVNADFRRGWSKFFRNAGIVDVPKIVISGSKMIAKFARDKRDEKILLLDSEKEIPVDKIDKKEVEIFEKFFKKIKKRNDWNNIENIENDRIHFMVACMESWFIADMETLSEFYGESFNNKKFKNWDDVEIISTEKVFDILKSATQNTKKGIYHKTRHSPYILEKLNVDIVYSKAFFCRRLLDYLRK